MDPPQPSQHHHRLHVHLDPGHHHHIHIHLCHHATHLLAAAPSAHHHHHHQAIALSFPSAHPHPAATPWHPGEPLTHAAAPDGYARAPSAPQQLGEAAKDWEEPAPGAEQGEDAYLEEEEEEEEEPVFVLTDEWAEFFAKADAKRKIAKQQKKKNMGRKR